MNETETPLTLDRKPPPRIRNIAVAPLEAGIHLRMNSLPSKCWETPNQSRTRIRFSKRSRAANIPSHETLLSPPQLHVQRSRLRRPGKPSRGKENSSRLLRPLRLRSSGLQTAPPSPQMSPLKINPASTAARSRLQEPERQGIIPEFLKDRGTR